MLLTLHTFHYFVFLYGTHTLGVWIIFTIVTIFVVDSNIEKDFFVGRPPTMSNYFGNDVETGRLFVFLLLARNSSCGARTCVGAAAVVAAGNGCTRVAAAVVDASDGAGTIVDAGDADGAATVDVGGCRPRK